MEPPPIFKRGNKEIARFCVSFVFKDSIVVLNGKLKHNGFKLNTIVQYVSYKAIRNY